jgi:hypothetical protein
VGTGEGNSVDVVGTSEMEGSKVGRGEGEIVGTGVGSIDGMDEGKGVGM